MIGLPSFAGSHIVILHSFHCKWLSDVVNQLIVKGKFSLTGWMFSFFSNSRSKLLVMLQLEHQALCLHNGNFLSIMQKNVSSIDFDETSSKMSLQDYIECPANREMKIEICSRERTDQRGI